MSPKSRPAKGGKGGKKGRKGKKGTSEETTRYTEVVEETTGPPFGIVVLIAVLMTLPTLMAYFNGAVEFRPTVLRLLAALLVSWLLCQLVYSVVNSFSSETTTETVETTTERRDEAYPPYQEDPYGDGRAAS